MHAEKSSFERVVVVGSCPAERQDAVMAAASLQPNLSIGFVKDAVLTKGKSVEEWEAHVVGQAVAMLSLYDVPHLHVVNISGGKNCLGGLLVRRARLVRSIKTASGQDDVRITIGFVGFDEFIEEFGSRRERTATGHHVTTVVAPADDDVASVKVESREEEEEEEEGEHLPLASEAPGSESANPKRIDDTDDSGAVVWGACPSLVRV